MMVTLKKLGISLWLLFAFYSVLSYLIFLRDDFLLERISLLTEAPWVLTAGRRWAKILHVNSLPTPLFFISVTAMFIVYGKALQLLRKRGSNTRNAKKTIIRFAVLFMMTTLFSFPALSTDVFDYIASNRVLFVHHANPWLEAPQNFPQDEFIYLGSWKSRASVYGPVQFLFSSLVHVFAQNNLIANIIGFKLTGALFAIALILLMKKWLEKFAPDNLLYGLTVFAWNPLIYIEIIGNAHNDIIMAFFTFLGFYWLTRRKSVSAAVGLSLAVLSKVAAALFVPIMAFWLLGRKRKRQTVVFVSLFALFTAMGILTLGEGSVGFVKNLGFQLGLYLRSLPTILRYAFLKVGFPESKALIAEKFLTIPLFAALFVMTTSKIKRIGLPAGMVIVMLGYLMLVSPMLQPWYLVWVLPFVALLSPGRLQTTALVFSFSSLMHYTVLFTSYYFSPLHFAWQIVMFMVIVLPPLAVWLTPKSWYTQFRRQR
ncbi:hypothetical protein IH980_04715 [Patescibacteria group bacterium]|nr:hypothetical protein [Patescibacteria group bacterium]